MSDEEACLYFNPSCSNCRGARGILEAQGVPVRIVEYLEERPSRAELERLMGMLGIADPRAMMREKEPQYAELGLATAGREALLDAMHDHPILLQRPILVRGDRAVIARPPERVRELLD